MNNKINKMCILFWEFPHFYLNAFIFPKKKSSLACEFIITTLLLLYNEIVRIIDLHCPVHIFLYKKQNHKI